MTISIRNLTDSDLDSADAILASAFGATTSRKDELRRYLTLQPDGWLVAEAGDGPMGMVGAVDYGAFAYIGMMAVLAEMQRRGIGRALMEHVLAWLDARRCPLSLLDATPFGARLYPKLGFVDDDRTETYVRQTSPSPQPPSLSHREREGGRGVGEVRPLHPSDLPALAEFDAPIFGADRTRLFEVYLRDFPQRAFVAHDKHGRISGYLFAQWRKIGPWAARTPQSAEALLGAALSLPFDEVAIVLTPSSNTAVADMLSCAGFKIQPSHRHMRRGGARHPGQRSLIYGQTSFALG